MKWQTNHLWLYNNHQQTSMEHSSLFFAWNLVLIWIVLSISNNSRWFGLETKETIQISILGCLWSRNQYQTPEKDIQQHLNELMICFFLFFRYFSFTETTLLLLLRYFYFVVSKSATVLDKSCLCVYDTCKMFCNHSLLFYVSYNKNKYENHKKTRWESNNDVVYVWFHKYLRA